LAEHITESDPTVCRPQETHLIKKKKKKGCYFEYNNKLGKLLKKKRRKRNSVKISNKV
jgi:hypothetical protein